MMRRSWAALILVHAVYFARGLARWRLVGWISPGVVLGIVTRLLSIV